MAYGILEQGFVRKTRDEIVASLTAKYQSKLGSDIDLSIYSEDGMRIQIEADEIDELWKVNEDIYYSNFFPTAKGASLDLLCARVGIQRSQAKRSLVVLQFSGDDATIIPVGTIVQTQQGIQFITIEEGVIDSGICNLQAQAVQPGPTGNVNANTITEMGTTLAGISGVTNPQPPSVAGRLRETNAELYQRFLDRTSNGGSSAAVIQALLNNLASINSAIVYENETDYTDLEGRPPHSMEAVVEGGTAEEIATIFLNNWPGGIESLGNETASIVDSKGQLRTYFYSNPEDLAIYVSLEIERDMDIWSGANEAIIKSNCIKLVGGTDTIGPTVSIYQGKGIGSSTYAWELIAAQAGIDDFGTVKVEGIKSMTAKIDRVTPPVTSAIHLTGKERPQLTNVRISITYI